MAAVTAWQVNADVNKIQVFLPSLTLYFAEEQSVQGTAGGSMVMVGIAKHAKVLPDS